MAKLLKNIYNYDYLHVVSLEIKKVYIDFDLEDFEFRVFDKEFESKELKQRMRHISTCIGLYFEKEYKKSIKILQKAFLEIDTKYSLENMIFQDFVEVYGLDDFKTSMIALESFTIGSSSEFAIRQFILKYPKKTMKQMLLWAKSSNLHVRRLASEGSRSRLPWAIALKQFKIYPDEVIEILEILKDDESAYVRKSVANSLNDISKDNPNLVKKIAKKWLGYTKQRDTLVKHSCRTLLKKGDKDILKLFGFTEVKHIHIEQFTHSKVVKEEQYLEFSFFIKSKKTLGNLRLEYKIEFLRKNGTYGEKVFKIGEGFFTCRDKKVIKKYSFRAISTRKYYKGVQKIFIIINGVVFKSGEFILE